MTTRTSAPDPHAREVLVVDDDEAIRLMLMEALELSGFQVRTAANGREALHDVEQHPPSVVLLDAIMPEMDGPAFLKEQRSKERGSAPSAPHIPVVVISAYPDRALPAMTDFGVEGFLPKPFRIQELVHLLDQVVPPIA
jgi:two-component system OmpR family response regulator